MADYPQTRFDRVLDVVHDYLPVRAQTWIEDRAFLKQVKHVGQETERKFGAHIDGTIERFNRESAPVVAQVKGQPDFFDKSIIPVYQQQKSNAPRVTLKDNVEYQQRRMWDEKQQQRAEAWSSASPVNNSTRQESATNTMKLTP